LAAYFRTQDRVYAAKNGIFASPARTQKSSGRARRGLTARRTPQSLCAHAEGVRATRIRDDSEL
jgi:hypothetical protein